MRFIAVPLLLLVTAACGPTQRSVQLFAADQPPALLSDWGVLIRQGDQLTLNDDVIPYELKTPLFSDYALKLRTVWMPADSAARYDPQTEFDFPVGTIISKTFHYQKANDWQEGNYRVLISDQAGVQSPLNLADNVLVETRLLVRHEDGWYGYPYVWNAAQTDATLEIAGDVRRITLRRGDTEEQLNYVVPDVNQCSGCHTPDHSAGEMRPLGPKSWQLDHSYAWWGNDSTQIENWREHDLLLEAPAMIKPAPTTLGHQAREYLDANCAHCHNPAGAADTSALHLNIDAPVDRKLGVCKTPVAVGRGSGDLSYDIYPGRPEQSIMIFRMRHSDPAIAMPELGRSSVHLEGVALISDWIATMSGEC